MPSSPIAIGTQLEPFFDDSLLERLDGAQLRLHAPVRREVVLQTDQPFESSVSGYYHLLRDGDRIRLYYRGYYPTNTGTRDLSIEQTTNLAESADGIHFTRPELGIVEFNGSKRNNIVLQGTDSHNLFVFRDENPTCKRDERYKAVGGPWEKLFGLVSPDGLHWQRIQETPLDVKGVFDSLNVVFWDPLKDCYRMFARYWEKRGAINYRAIQSCESKDFIHWTEPQPHQYAAGVPLDQFYTNATIRCPGAEHLLLSFPKRFIPDRTKIPEDSQKTAGMLYPGKSLSEAVFMTSRDGVHWQRPFREAWVRPGPDERNWTHRSNMPAVGIFELTPGEWSLYIGEHYGWPTNRVRRVTVRRHGFASLNGNAVGGTALTKPIVFSGKNLVLNYASSAAGSVRVELQDEAGKPLDGFALADMEPLFGDELTAVVAWKNNRVLAALAGLPVRLRFELTDTDLYSMQFKN